MSGIGNAYPAHAEIKNPVFSGSLLLAQGAHAIFAGSPKQRDFWLGHGRAAMTELRERYGGPKPCLWGCDAHELARVAKQMRIGCGRHFSPESTRHARDQ